MVQETADVHGLRGFSFFLEADQSVGRRPAERLEAGDVDRRVTAVGVYVDGVD
jgi:hypothetical protein